VQTQTVQLSSQYSAEAVPTFARRSTLAPRVPRRSVCQVHCVALTGEASDAASSATIPVDVWQHLKHHSPLTVAAFPSNDLACRFHVFIDSGTVLKKLDLPSTARVETRQKFVAVADDRLLFNWAAILCHGSGPHCLTAGVSAILSCLDTGHSVSLLGRSVKLADTAPDRDRVNARASVSFRVPISGNYELRLIGAVDPNRRGCESHFLVDSVRIADSEDRDVKHLASMSCAGRVRP
jgi:hypothetical protein